MPLGAFAERYFGVRVLDVATRHALLRRLARSPEHGVAPAVAESSCFAVYASDALDAQADAGNGTLPRAFRAAYSRVVDEAGLVTERGFWRERRTTNEALPPLAIDATIAPDGVPDWLAAFTQIDLVVLGDIEPPTAERPRDLAAIASLLSFLEDGGDDALRAFSLSAISPLRPNDARAIAVAAAREGSFARTLASGRIVLDASGREALHRLRDGIAAVERAYRAPDASALSTVAALAVAFDLTAHLPYRMIRAVRSVCAAFDQARTLVTNTWSARDLVADLDAAITAVDAAVSVPVHVPLADAEPLAARAVTVRRNTYSASSLNAYVECARKWYFRYVCAAVEDPGSAAATYGRAFHAALEEFHLAYPRAGDVAPDVLDRTLRGYVTAAFDRYRGGLGSNVEFELQRRRAVRTASRYARYIVDRFRRAPFTVIGCELEIAVELAGYKFVGFIDRVDRDDRTGGIAIIDYKTGAIAKTAADYRAEVLSFADFQLPFYYWSQTAAGERVTSLALVPLRDAHLDVRPVELEVIPVPLVDGGRNGNTTMITVGELERARAKMIEICATISGGTLDHFPATDDPEACRWCAYADACREQPAFAEARFAR